MTSLHQLAAAQHTATHCCYAETGLYSSCTAHPYFHLLNLVVQLGQECIKIRGHENGQLLHSEEVVPEDSPIPLALFALHQGSHPSYPICQFPDQSGSILLQMKVIILPLTCLTPFVTLSNTILRSQQPRLSLIFRVPSCSQIAGSTENILSSAHPEPASKLFLLHSKIFFEC